MQGKGDIMADTLIAYYSWSGRSAALAAKLHDDIPGSDLYHIETKRKYSGSFFICAGQAMQEYERLCRTVIMPGFPDLRHLNVIGQHKAEACVLHDGLCVKLHSSRCHS